MLFKWPISSSVGNKSRPGRLRLIWKWLSAYRTLLTSHKPPSQAWRKRAQHGNCGPASRAVISFAHLSRKSFEQVTIVRVWRVMASVNPKSNAKFFTKLRNCGSEWENKMGSDLFWSHVEPWNAIHRAQFENFSPRENMSHSKSSLTTWCLWLKGCIHCSGC